MTGLMSAFGTKQTSGQRSAMSAFGGKADVRQIGSAIADSACDGFKYVVPHPEQTRIRIA
jgi:hypothetical protein